MMKLEDNEQILYTARKHWFIFAGEIIFAAIFAFMPLVFFILPEPWYASVSEALRFEGNLTVLFMFLWCLWLLLLWIVTAVLWTDYYLDVWLITNHRVIDVEQLGMFNRKISAFRFDQIQDVTVEVPGLIATFIDFGTVKIRTASDEVFSFGGVSYPNHLKEKIMTEHHRVHSASPANEF